MESQDLSQCLEITRSFPTSCISEGHVGNSNEVPLPLPVREVSVVRSQHSHPYPAVTRNPRGEPGFPPLPGSNEVLPPTFQHQQSPDKTQDLNKIQNLTT